MQNSGIIGEVKVSQIHTIRILMVTFHAFQPNYDNFDDGKNIDKLSTTSLYCDSPFRD